MDCGGPCCNDHFDRVVKRCISCKSQKNSPSPEGEDRAAARKEKADLESQNAALRAEQQAILDDIYHRKEQARLMAEQAEVQLRKNFDLAAQRLRQRELDFDEKVKMMTGLQKSDRAYVDSSMYEREQLRASMLKAQEREEELARKAKDMTELMGVPSFQKIEPHLDRMLPFTAEIEPLPLIDSQFIDGPYLEAAPTLESRLRAITGQAPGDWPNNVPFSTRITGPADDFELPKRFPLTAGSATPGGGGGGPPDDRSTTAATVTADDFLLAVSLERDKKPDGPPPGSPQGGPGGGGGGGGGSGDVNPIDQWRQAGNNREISLLDIPDVTSLREWKQHAIRAVARASPDVHGAQAWVMQAMDPSVTAESLKHSGNFLRLDMMIATELIEKCIKLKKKGNMSVHHTHFLAKLNRMEYERQLVGTLLTGREMIRAICVWCSVRSDLGQHRICRDILKVYIDRQKPDQDLYHFYNEWMEVYQELYGARPPSDEMRAAIHTHFYEQLRCVPKLSQIIGWYDMCADKTGTGMRTYEWLLFQVENLMMRDHDTWAIAQKESTLNSRGRAARYAGGGTGGGKGSGKGGLPRNAAPAEVRATLGRSSDVTKSGLTKGQTLCNYTRKGEQCPFLRKGCPFNHQKPRTPAAPAQPSAAGGNHDAAPGQTRGRPRQPSGPSGPRQPSGPRSQTPNRGGPPQNTHRTRSQSQASRERQSRMICFAYSRAPQNCRGAKDGCYKQHKAEKDMTDKQRMMRDQYEEKLLKAGKALGYARSAKQANAAAANVGNTGRSPSAGSGGKPRSHSPSSQKGKGKKGKKGNGKGKPPIDTKKPCPSFKETGKCSRGADCWFRANTPGHP